MRAYYKNGYGQNAYLPDFGARTRRLRTVYLRCTYPFIKCKYITQTIRTIYLYIYTLYSAVLLSYTSMISF